MMPPSSAPGSPAPAPSQEGGADHAPSTRRHEDPVASQLHQEPGEGWQRLRAGQWYRADESCAQHSRRAQELTHAFESAVRGGDDAAAATALDQLIGALGERVVVRPPLHVDYGSLISIGEGTFINFGLTVLDTAQVTIGRDCQFGPQVQLLPPIHPIDPQLRRALWESGRPITIGDNVWLGGGVIVCPGVSIGDNAVIGAGAVVVKDIPADCVAVGNPARVVRHLE